MCATGEKRRGWPRISLLLSWLRLLVLVTNQLANLFHHLTIFVVSRVAERAIAAAIDRQSCLNQFSDRRPANINPNLLPLLLR
jgi:hypothetical protein